MKGDAVVAPDSDGDGKRDQFLGLGVERLWCKRGLRDCGEGLHDFWRSLPQVAEMGRKLSCLLRPIGHTALSDSTPWCSQTIGSAERRL
jgi:hypothetical protein